MTGGCDRGRFVRAVFTDIHTALVLPYNLHYLRKCVACYVKHQCNYSDTILLIYQLGKFADFDKYLRRFDDKHIKAMYSNSNHSPIIK